MDRTRSKKLRNHVRQHGSPEIKTGNSHVAQHRLFLKLVETALDKNWTQIGTLLAGNQLPTDPSGKSVLLHFLQITPLKNILPFFKVPRRYLRLTPCWFADRLNILSTIRKRGFLGRLPPPRLVSPKRQPTHLILAGGGPLGIAYLGVFKTFGQQTLNNFQRVGGVSVGSIAATLLACGATIDQLEQWMGSLDFTTLLDPKSGTSQDVLAALDKVHNFSTGNWLDKIKSAVSTIVAIQKNKPAACHGEKLRLWVEDKMNQLTGISFLTLGELQKLILKQGEKTRAKHLHIWVSKVVNSNTTPVRYSTEGDGNDANLIISDLVRASASVPVLFDPHYLYIKQNGKRQKKDETQYLDGGLKANFPLQAFGERRFIPRLRNSRREGDEPIFNSKVIGFNFHDEQTSKESKPIKGLKDTVMPIVNSINSVELAQHRMNRHNAKLIVSIPRFNFQLTNFGMKPVEKYLLMIAGAKATCDYLHPKKVLIHIWSGSEVILDQKTAENERAHYTLSETRKDTGLAAQSAFKLIHYYYKKSVELKYAPSTTANKLELKIHSELCQTWMQCFLSLNCVSIVWPNAFYQMARLYQRPLSNPQQLAHYAYVWTQMVDLFGLQSNSTAAKYNKLRLYK